MAVFFGLCLYVYFTVSFGQRRRGGNRKGVKIEQTASLFLFPINIASIADERVDANSH